VGVAAIAADSSSSSASAVTFNKDVLPILQKNCQTCHRPGQMAPMSFLTYQSTRPWAKAMKAATSTHKMPPWFADPQVGHFLNDRSLKPGEIETIAKWATEKFGPAPNLPIGVTNPVRKSSNTPLAWPSCNGTRITS